MSHTLTKINKHIKYLEYFYQVVENNQSVTVLKKENKQGKRLVKLLKSKYLGGIDGFNDGAAWVGLCKFGHYTIKLDHNQGDFYMTYDGFKKSFGCTVNTIIIEDILKGIEAVEK